MKGTGLKREILIFPEFSRAIVSYLPALVQLRIPPDSHLYKLLGTEQTGQQQ